MVAVTKKKYQISPTLRLTDGDGRATAEFYRVLTAIGVLLETISIEPGEITEEKLAALAVSAAKLQNGAVVIGKLAAGSIHVSTLFADSVVITNKVAANAISELTGLVQVGSVGPGGTTILSGSVPVTSTGNTGLLLTFTAFMDKPTFDPANFGEWSIQLNRNGVQIASTPPLYYDDNFSYQPVASFIDPTPGSNPTYSLTCTLHSGLGNFNVSGGVLNVGLLKR